MMYILQDTDHPSEMERVFVSGHLLMRVSELPEISVAINEALAQLDTSIEVMPLDELMHYEASGDYEYADVLLAYAILDSDWLVNHKMNLTQVAIHLAEGGFEDVIVETG